VGYLKEGFAAYFMQIDVQGYLVNGGALFHPYLSLYFQIRSFIAANRCFEIFIWVILLFFHLSFLGKYHCCNWCRAQQVVLNIQPRLASIIRQTGFLPSCLLKRI
jgi:hypothetical protein